VDGVFLQEQDGERFLLDTQSGEVYRVNATAARIFSLCRSRATFEGAAQELVRGLSTPPSEAEVLKDVRGAVHQLQELGLCEPLRAG
jgi:coenzyme PQQ synthesis protein D (PqqD)